MASAAMSPGFSKTTRSAGGPSTAKTGSEGTPSSSLPGFNSFTPRSASTSLSPSSSTATPHRPSQQRTEQRNPHGGAALSNESEARLRSQVQKLSISAQPNKAGVSNPKSSTHSSGPNPAADTQMRKTEPLSKDVNLPLTMRNFVLKDKVAIVTGGARGLGLNMAQALCESGIKAVAIFDILSALGDSVAKSLHTDTDIPVKYYNVDVTNEKNVESAVRQVVQQFGGVDILVNSAGVVFSNIHAEFHSLDVFQKTININLVGSFCIARAVGRHMIAATTKTSPASRQRLPDRSIIFVASMSGSIVNYPQPQCAYNASKAGVVQLSKCLAAEWARYGIRVNTISPGYMDTVLNKTPALNSLKVVWKERTPLGRLGEVDELNSAVLWLAGEGARFVTGADIKLDGGYSVY